MNQRKSPDMITKLYIHHKYVFIFSQPKNPENYFSISTSFSPLIVRNYIYQLIIFISIKYPVIAALIIMINYGDKALLRQPLK